MTTARASPCPQATSKNRCTIDRSACEASNGSKPRRGVKPLSSARIERTAADWLAIITPACRVEAKGRAKFGPFEVQSARCSCDCSFPESPKNGCPYNRAIARVEFARPEVPDARHTHERKAAWLLRKAAQTRRPNTSWQPPQADRSRRQTGNASLGLRTDAACS